MDDNKPALSIALVQPANQPAPASGPAHRCQQLDSRPLQVRAGSRDRVSEPDHPAPAMTGRSSLASIPHPKSRRILPTAPSSYRKACACCERAVARPCIDAIYFACRDKLMSVDKGQHCHAASDHPAERRRRQPEPRFDVEEAVEMAQRAEVIIYAISTNTSGLVTARR